VIEMGVCGREKEGGGGTSAGYNNMGVRRGVGGNLTLPPPTLILASYTNDTTIITTTGTGTTTTITASFFQQQQHCHRHNHPHTGNISSARAGMMHHRLQKAR